MTRRGANPGIRCLLALVLGLAACDNSVSPIDNDPDQFFAVHGFLDMSADTQFVRIEALRSTILNQAPLVLDASVTSTDARTGTATTWRDSVVTLDDGTRGHLFFAVFKPEAGVTYQLDVSRTDGKRTRATTRVPPVPVLLPDTPQGSFSFLFQPVTLARIEQPIDDASVQYQVYSPLTDSLETVSIAYGTPGKTTAAGWGVDIFLARDARTIFRRHVFADPADSVLALRGLRLAFDLPSSEWRNPTLSLNIEHGVGFFGSVGKYSVGWRLEPEVVGALGFEDEQAP